VQAILVVDATPANAMNTPANAMKVNT